MKKLKCRGESLVYVGAEHIAQSVINRHGFRWNHHLRSVSLCDYHELFGSLVRTQFREEVLDFFSFEVGKKIETDFPFSTLY